jgi:predicted RNase H-like nuclease
VALATEHDGTPPRLEICATFRAVLELVGDSGIVVIDIPIGLLDEPHPGGRKCDIAARKRLGPRRSSVFSPPARSALSETRWEQARHCGLTRQGFAILPKIREVDALMTSALQKCAFESHPELAFCALAGRPMEQGKKRHAGRVERRNALSRAADAGFGGLLVDLAGELEAAERQFTRKQVGVDDLLDACVMLWVAARVAAFLRIICDAVKVSGVHKDEPAPLRLRLVDSTHLRAPAAHRLSSAHRLAVQRQARSDRTIFGSRISFRRSSTSARMA